MAKAGSGFFNENGTILLDGIVRMSIPGIPIKWETVNSDNLQIHVLHRRFPLLVAYKTGKLDGHMNVIYDYDSSSKMVRAMDPWFPDPSLNPKYEFRNVLDESGKAVGLVCTHADTGASFPYTGTHASRPLDYYFHKPFIRGFIVGYNPD